MDLAEVASKLAAPGKGLLASDESTGTIGKRLEKVGKENTEENRRSYRELYYTAPIGEYISGVIMYKETLYQSTTDGKRFVNCLEEQGVMPGIKVDEGLEPLAQGREGETHTKGLEVLEASCKEYVKGGAKFAKWRATLKIAEGCPTEAAIETNAQELAAYALICQKCGLVPIVEPEILIDGTYSITDSAAVSERVISACYKEMWRNGASLEGSLLKPQMVIQGADCPLPKPSPHDVAHYTVRTLRRVVPPAVPGVMFLSGGQSEEEATVNLQAINLEAKTVGRCPWSLSFSYGRALQHSVLKMWSADPTKTSEAQHLAVALARVNSEAALGRYQPGSHPSLEPPSAHLRETFRGWAGQAPAQV